MKSIIEREASFENNSDIEITVKQKTSSRAFVKDNNELKYAQQSNRLDNGAPKGSLSS